MADVAPNYREHEEFWKPAADPRIHSGSAVDRPGTPCPHCGGDLVAEAKFCHLCGAKIEEQPSRLTRFPLLVAPSKASRSGQTAGSVIALILGCICVVVAIAITLRFRAATFSDWQAIQLWRIQWLLAAIALFVAGLVLKHK